MDCDACKKHCYLRQVLFQPATYTQLSEWHQHFHQLHCSLFPLKLSVKLVNHLSHHETAHSLQNNPKFSENTHPSTSLYLRNEFQTMMCIATTHCALDTVTGVLNDITNLPGGVSKSSGLGPPCGQCTGG